MNKIVLELSDTELETLVMQVSAADSYDAKQLKKKVEKAVKWRREYAEFEQRILVAISETFGVSLDLLQKIDNSEEHF